MFSIFLSQAVEYKLNIVASHSCTVENYGGNYAAT